MNSIFRDRVNVIKLGLRAGILYIFTTSVQDPWHATRTRISISHLVGGAH